jgi:hypothetical protein
MTRGDSLFAAVLAMVLFARLANELQKTLPAEAPADQNPERQAASPSDGAGVDVPPAREPRRVAE